MGVKGPDRRQVLGALAAAGTITWLADRRVVVDHERARAGATITLKCTGADHWQIRCDGQTATVKGREGVARFRAPFLGESGGFAQLVCEPMDAAGQGIAAPATVEILRAPLLFGA